MLNFHSFGWVWKGLDRVMLGIRFWIYLEKFGKFGKALNGSERLDKVWNDWYMFERVLIRTVYGFVYVYSQIKVAL